MFGRRSLVEKFISIVGLGALCFLLCAPQPVFAQTTNALTMLDQTTAASGLGTTDLYTIIGRILRIFYGLLGIIAIVLVIYGGYTWMTAAGDEKKVEQAKNILRNAVIGLLIIMAAFGITEFVMSKLFGATTGGGGTEEGGGQTTDTELATYDGKAVLGKVIDSHDPTRNAVGVPRNKLITVVFKIPFHPASLINSKNGGMVEQGGKIISGPLNNQAVQIFASAAGASTALTSEQVKVHVVYDDDGQARSFVLQPMVLLGSGSQEVPYTVTLTNGIQKAIPLGAGIFGGLSADYSWNFTVSTITDNTPPRVKAVVPLADGTFDRNITIQIIFTEPINLASAVGTYDGKEKKFTNITARLNDLNGAPLSGKWQAGPGFTSLEFTPFDGCGKNSCGVDIFCLPAASNIMVLARAGELQEAGSPQAKIGLTFSGVTDTAGNALDGGGEKAAKPWSTNGGTPQGSPADDFYFQFKTTDAKKITAPKINKVDPPIKGAGSTETYQTDLPITIDFDSLMKVTTFNGIELRAKLAKAQAGYWKSAENLTQTINGQTGGYTQAQIKHVPLVKNQPYAGVIPSSVQDVYQNCYLPAAGLSCDAGQQKSAGTLYCCNGIPSNSQCELLQYGAAAK